MLNYLKKQFTEVIRAARDKVVRMLIKLGLLLVVILIAFFATKKPTVKVKLPDFCNGLSDSVIRADKVKYRRCYPHCDRGDQKCFEHLRRHQ